MNNKERLAFYKSIVSKTSSFNWKLDPGYHEVEGTKQEKAPSLVAIKQTEVFLQNKQFEDALKCISAATKNNQDNRDLAVAELKCLMATQHPETSKRYQMWSKRFPKDFRIKILGLRFIKEAKARASKFIEILSELEKSDNMEIEARTQIVIATISAELRSDPAFFLVAEKAIEIYPRAYQLKFLIADKLEKTGDNIGALKIFEEILEAKHMLRVSGQFLAGTDRGYMASWVQALRKRVES